MQPQVLGAGQTKRDDLPGPFRDSGSAPTTPTMRAAAVVTFPLEGSPHVSLTAVRYLLRGNHVRPIMHCILVLCLSNLVLLATRLLKSHASLLCVSVCSAALYVIPTLGLRSPPYVEPALVDRSMNGVLQVWEQMLQRQAVNLLFASGNTVSHRSIN